MYEFFKCNYDGILENKLLQPYGEFPRGMRLSKVLMKEFGLDAEDVRQKLSMLIQSNKVTGTLCISIHPLDYLSASENNHGWRSCHALDGEYRAGNISYMLDNCTIIAYLRSNGDPVNLPRFPRDVKWNDKKWRVYLHVDRVNKIIYAGRQYPFHTDRGLELIADMIRNLWWFMEADERQAAVEHANRVSHRNEWDEETYKQHFISYHRFHHWGLKGPVVINDEPMDFCDTKFIVSGDRWGDGVKIVPGKNYIHNKDEALNFNDVIQSHTYSPWILSYSEEFRNDYLPPAVNTPLLVGEGVPCICCGERAAHDSDTLLCSRCHDQDVEYMCCEICGDEYPSDALEYVPGHGYVCPDCAYEIRHGA